MLGSYVIGFTQQRLERVWSSRLSVPLLMLCTVTTIALTVAGTGASALWFLAVLRKLGLRLRFAPA